jgi:hypothetical protein
LRPRAAALSGLAWMVLTPPALAAQHTLDVIPTIGAYIPTGRMFDEYQTGCACHSTITQQSGLLYGIHLAFGAEMPVTLETTADFGISRVQVVQPTEPIVNSFGTVIILGARLRVSARRGAVTTPYLSGGVAYLTHVSNAYLNLSGADAMALALGAGLRVVIGRQLIGRIDFENYHYGVTLGGGTTPPQHDNDLLLSVGIGVEL